MKRVMGNVDVNQHQPGVCAQPRSESRHRSWSGSSVEVPVQAGFDQNKNRAWAYSQENSDATWASRPITYGELVKRTGIEFLPSVNPGAIESLGVNSPPLGA